MFLDKGKIVDSQEITFSSLQKCDLYKKLQLKETLDYEN